MKLTLMTIPLLALAACQLRDRDEVGTREKRVPLYEERADTKARIEKKADSVERRVETATGESTVGTELTASQLLDKLHLVSLSHVEMGNVAQTRAVNNQVKSLGERMAKDFNKLDQSVVDYAKDHGIVLSDALDMNRKVDPKKAPKITVDGKATRMDKIDELRGSAFDQGFLTATVESCSEFISLLEGFRGKFDDKGFDSAVEKAIDTLKSFRDDATKLQGTDLSAS